MEVSYYVEYKDYIDSVKNRIFNINSEFDNLKKKFIFDYKNGLIDISSSEYEFFLKQSILEVNSSIPSKYQLLEEDRMFIKEYADINASGNITSSFIKDVYSNKLKVMEEVISAISAFLPYENLTLAEKRNLFFNSFKKDCDLRKLNNITKMNEIKDRLQDRCVFYPEYTSLKAQIDEDEMNLTYLSNILKNCDEDYIIKAISEYNGVNYYYYLWFAMNRSNNRFNEGNMIKDAVDSTSMIETSVSFLEKDNNELDSLNSRLIDLFNKKIFILSLNRENIVKKSIFTKRNKENLLKIFDKYVKIDGIQDFFNKYGSENTFDNYYETCYGLLTVDENAFEDDLISNICLYLDEQINSVSQRIDILKNSIKNNLKGAFNGIGIAKRKLVSCDNDLRYLSYRDIKLPALTNEEANELFLSIREYLKLKNEFAMKKILRKDK